MKYLPTLDVSSPGVSAALREGALRLQPGQWIACGSGPKSRFSHVSEPGRVIVAFHFPNAAGKFLRYRQDGKAAAALCAANRALRLNSAFAWAKK